MPLPLRWVLGIVIALAVLLAAAAFALHAWLGSADFRSRAAAQASQALGVPVAFDNLSLALFPLPAIAVDGLSIRSQPALTLERVEVRPVWSRALLHGRPEIATVRVRNAVVPQDAVGAILAAFDKAHPKKAGAPAQPAAGDPLAMLPRHVVLEKVTWVNAKGGRGVIDADAHLEGDPWVIDVKLGGGSVHGTLHLQPGPRGERILRGAFDTARVEVSSFTAPSRTLTGRLDAHTDLQGDLAKMPDALHTETKFTIRDATLHGIDLAQAVRTVGINRSGETKIDALAGQVVTQGKVVRLNNLVASSGAMSAHGNVTLSPDRHLNGEITVSLAAQTVGQALGVPLVVSGTLDAPSVSLSRSALIGAALGTAIAPGIGTGAGASLGDKLGNGLKGLFGK